MSEFPENAGKVLTGLARASIAQGLQYEGRSCDSRSQARSAQDDGKESVQDDGKGANAWLDAPGAAFVTLTQAGQLRGCIGSLVAHRALRDDVASNARAAAFDDPRFMPLQADELARTRIEVSVLSAPVPMPFTSRQDALAQLRPGVDGVILSAGRRRATFLPQVWDELPDQEDFIQHLFRKAGLPANYWGDDVAISRYTVTAFIEDEP